MNLETGIQFNGQSFNKLLLPAKLGR